MLPHLADLGVPLLDDPATLLAQVLHQASHNLELDAEAVGHLLLGPGPLRRQSDDLEASLSAQLAERTLLAPWIARAVLLGVVISVTLLGKGLSIGELKLQVSHFFEALDLLLVVLPLHAAANGTHRASGLLRELEELRLGELVVGDGERLLLLLDRLGVEDEGPCLSHRVPADLLHRLVGDDVGLHVLDLDALARGRVHQQHPGPEHGRRVLLPLVGVVVHAHVVGHAVRVGLVVAPLSKEPIQLGLPELHLDVVNFVD